MLDYWPPSMESNPSFKDTSGQFCFEAALSLSLSRPCLLANKLHRGCSDMIIIISFELRTANQFQGSFSAHVLLKYNTS